MNLKYKHLSKQQLGSADVRQDLIADLQPELGALESLTEQQIWVSDGD